MRFPKLLLTGLIAFFSFAFPVVGISAAAPPDIGKRPDEKPSRLNNVEAQRDMYAVSAGTDGSGKTYVVLFWTRAEDAPGYNVYRREEPTPGFPSVPINGKTPITAARTCDQLKAIIPENSAEWKMISDAFSSLRAKERLGAKAALSCEAFNSGLTSQEEAILDIMAAANLKIRLARGTAFLDKDVTAGKTYVYQLRKLNEKGSESLTAAKVKVKAGYFVLPDPPEGITALPGDTKVLVLWNRRDAASGFIVGRSTSASGTYLQINQEPVVFDIDKDLEGGPLSRPKPGFVDFQRWDEEGAPVAHEVTSSAGVTVFVNGPRNNIKYYYKVASVDILGRQGPWSHSPVSARPLDKTAPRAPSDLKVDASSYPLGISVSWRKVVLDALGHRELDAITTYNIYRSDKLDYLEEIAALAPSSSLFVKGVSADPSDTNTITLSWTDTDPLLVPAFGEKDFYYRLQCVDTSGNISAPSAVLAGRIPDTTPPGPTTMKGSKGYADHNRIFWDENTEKDLGGYQIYVGLCDMGMPYRPESKTQKEAYNEPCDFSLVGELLLSEAKKRMADTGQIFFDDYSVTAGSSVCYAYWIRAFDTARNVYPGRLSGGCPDIGEYVCQKLLEEEAPPVPVISAMKARSNSVIIEWLASPLQDLKAFHVYRSENKDASPSFVASVLTDGTVSLSRWEGLSPRCEDIPAEANPTAVLASFEDKGIEPGNIYWYRVSALDWLGNESEKSDISKIPALSTFTYTRDIPPTPVLLAPGPQPSKGCGLVVKWTPAFDPASWEGFIVFRGPSASGSFRQISPVVKGNEFTDTTALRGMDHYYRVQTMDTRGHLSEPSAPALYRY